jgi:hypothetical protein
MKADTFSTYLKTHRLLAIGLVLVAFVLCTLLLANRLPPGIDWNYYFQPAALKLLMFQSPYDIWGFPSPPWALLPMLPFAILPSALSRAGWFVLSLIMFAWSVYRLGAKPIALAAFVGSPLVMHSLLNANIDWMVIFGFTLPPQIGLFFISVKPQMGSVVAVFWLAEAWRKGRAREVVRVFAPFTIVLLLSFVLFGFYPLEWVTVEVDQWWNASLWPMSIPIGLTLAVAALYRRKIQFAMAASPLLSPYVLFHAYSGALSALATYTVEMVTAVIGLWILVLMRALHIG